MKRGTIVLTKFPFTDLKSSKRRPAVVVSKKLSKKDDVILAFISSVIPKQPSETDFIFDDSNPDFNKSGLKKKSVIMTDKLITLNKSIFTGELGIITSATMKVLNSKLKLALDIPD